MTGQAIGCEVSAVQDESGRDMVEGHLPPTVLVMAGNTTGFRGIFFGVPEVRILVTCDAGTMRRREVGSLLNAGFQRAVACIARSCAMGTHQGESRCIMTGQGKSCGPEPFHRVAVFALQ